MHVTLRIGISERIEVFCTIVLCLDTNVGDLHVFNNHGEALRTDGTHAGLGEI